MDMSGLYLSGIPNKTPNIPFGDHLAPGTQPGGAFEGQVPKRSLYGLYEWPKSQRVRVGWRTLSRYGESIDAIPIGRMPGNQ